tara:strand:+ start:480 stop:632 length:153 start_codon:yes stop_codon:yes gene_type:complete
MNDSKQDLLQITNLLKHLLKDSSLNKQQINIVTDVMAKLQIIRKQIDPQK